MKISFLVAAFLCTVYSSEAQSGVQLKAGLNLANISVNENGRVDEANRLNSFAIGLVADIKLGGPLYFQPGILYTGKGSKTERGTQGSNGYFRQTFKPYYIELPANFVVKAPVGGGAQLFAGAGPYLAIGIRGSTNTTGQTLLGATYNLENKIEFSNDDPSTLNEEEGAGFGIVKRFDYGLNAIAGVEGKSIVLSVGYGVGLAKLQSGASNGTDNNNKHRVLNFSFGFKL